MDVPAYAGEWRRLRKTPPYTSLGGVFLFGLRLAGLAALFCWTKVQYSLATLRLASGNARWAVGVG